MIGVVAFTVAAPLGFVANGMTPLAVNMGKSCFLFAGDIGREDAFEDGNGEEGTAQNPPRLCRKMSLIVNHIEWGMFAALALAMR